MGKFAVPLFRSHVLVPAVVLSNRSNVKLGARFSRPLPAALFSTMRLPLAPLPKAMPARVLFERWFRSRAFPLEFAFTKNPQSLLATLFSRTLLLLVPAPVNSTPQPPRARRVPRDFGNRKIHLGQPLALFGDH